METLGSALLVALNIAKVVFGLGFVIFIHELGHFLAAKWFGVKVNKFFLGFDWPFGLRILSFQYGETTYGIGALPLGGYVSMLGETPDEDPDRAADPRSFANKSVGARSVILSAGVVMNLVLGLILFSITQMIGVVETPPRLGMVQPGSPAYEAGLRPGDEIVGVNGKGDVHFNRLRTKIILTPANRELTLAVLRAPSTTPIAIKVAPNRGAKSDRPTIGINPCSSLVLVSDKPYIAPPGTEGTAPAKDAVPAEWAVVEAGPSGGPLRAVKDEFDLDRILVENADRPIDVVMENPKAAKDGSTDGPRRVTLPVNRMLAMGLRMAPGAVESIQPGSIAEKAGFRKGDRIVEVDGRRDFDPLTLPRDLYARRGKPTAFVVERDGGAGPVSIEATPDDSAPSLYLAADLGDPVNLINLGMAMGAGTKVAEVAPGGPADRAGIKVGDVVREALVAKIKEDGPKATDVRLVLGPLDPARKDASKGSWAGLIHLFQSISRRPVQLYLEGRAEPVTVSPEPDPHWSNPLRGLNFRDAFREVPPQPFLAAVRRGADETYDNVISIYAVLRSLFQGRLSPQTLMGIPRIGGAAYQAASLGVVPLFHLLAALSINLAVLNFLPIPPLDGGQIAFLVAEKVRGKPLPDTALFVFVVAGIVLVVGLMLFTIIQDIVILVVGG